MGPDWRARDILPSEQNSERNIIKKEKIRGGGFFPKLCRRQNITRVSEYHFAEGEISLSRSENKTASYGLRALDPCGSVGFPKENGGVQPPRQSRSLP